MTFPFHRSSHLILEHYWGNHARIIQFDAKSRNMWWKNVHQYTWGWKGRCTSSRPNRQRERRALEVTNNFSTWRHEDSASLMRYCRIEKDIRHSWLCSKAERNDWSENSATGFCQEVPPIFRILQNRDPSLSSSYKLRRLRRRVTFCANPLMLHPCVTTTLPIRMSFWWKFCPASGFLLHVIELGLSFDFGSSNRSVCFYRV